MVIPKEERAQRCPSVSVHHAAAWFLAFMGGFSWPHTSKQQLRVYEVLMYQVCSEYGYMLYVREIFFSVRHASYFYYIGYVVKQQHDVK